MHSQAPGHEPSTVRRRDPHPQPPPTPPSRPWAVADRPRHWLLRRGHFCATPISAAQPLLEKGGVAEGDKECQKVTNILHKLR